MREIEVKILEIDIKEMKTKLEQLGAKKTFEGKVEMTIFDHPLLHLQEKDEVLRVRTVGDAVELCYKGKKEPSRFKVREEIEVNTSSFVNTVKIVEHLGFIKIHHDSKERISYSLKNVKLEFDTLPGIPPFLEIEGMTEDDVIQVIEKLGYTMDDTTPMSAREVLKYYNTKYAKTEQ